LNSPIEEAESLVAQILRAYQLTRVDLEVTAQALDCCRRIREDSSSASLAGYELAALVERLRARANIARMYAPIEGLDERAHSNAVERRKAYWLEYHRGFSHPEACKRAAAKLSVSPKTIVRALKGY
jgi:hypothetical protein